MCTCTECGGKGYIITSRVPLTVRRCACLRKASNLLRLRRLGLERQYELYSFERYRTDEPWQQQTKSLALRYCDEPDGWFIISGQSGSGKSHICVAIVCRLLERFGRVEYFRWVDDSKRLKTLATDREREEELQRYKSADVLYIDDFLKTTPTEADRSLAFELLNSAYAGGQRVILSSERSLPAILAWDEAIGGRIRERADPYRLTLNGADKNYRLLPHRSATGADCKAPKG